MHLIIASILMVATLSVANAQGNAPQAGYILGASSTEFGVSSHMLYVTYPGVNDDSASFVIEKREGNSDVDYTYNAIHTYKLTTAEEAKKPFTYFFALDGTTKGNYTVKICNANEACSKPSSPPTIIDDGQGRLDCKEKSQDVEDIPIPKITEYATQDELTNYKKKMLKSIATTKGIMSNPSFEDAQTEKDEGFMYFLVKYKLSAFKKLFEVPEDEDKFCQKKYTFMIVTQVFEKKTKKVLARGRFTPRTLTDDEIEEYITGAEEKAIMIEFKLDVSKELAQKSGLKTWHSVCISAKDMVTSREKGFAVKCSDPFENDWIPIANSGSEAVDSSSA